MEFMIQPMELSSELNGLGINVIACNVPCNNTGNCVAGCACPIKVIEI